jgi:ADP-ribosylation factor-like protein 1
VVQHRLGAPGRTRLFILCFPDRWLWMLGAIRSKFLGRQECRVIVIGLDGSGKTTIVHRLKHGKLDDSEIIRACLYYPCLCACCAYTYRTGAAREFFLCVAATIGFKVECVEYRKMIFSLWDLGGGLDARSFWRFYYPDTQAIIFVVDSSDLDRMVN